MHTGAGDRNVVSRPHWLQVASLQFFWAGFYFYFHRPALLCVYCSSVQHLTAYLCIMFLNCIAQHVYNMSASRTVTCNHTVIHWTNNNRVQLMIKGQGAKMSSALGACAGCGWPDYPTCWLLDCSLPATCPHSMVDQPSPLHPAPSCLKCTSLIG